MRKIFLAIILSSILVSCQSDKILYGTWIAAYQYHPNDSLKKPNNGRPFNEVITFDNGIYKIKSYKYWMYYDQRQEKYSLKGKRLMIENGENNYEDFLEVKKDSFVFIGKSGISNSVYKKLADSLKNKSSDIKFIGKRFIRNYKKLTDTIKFINDSVYISNSLATSNSDFLKYERINHNGFDILFTEIYPPFIIKNKNSQDILISTIGTKKEDYILKEIE
ncbi:hypothetical protein [Aquimarina amphilecti]|nr:hypothetical protein [Aquimarina amphilecti]